MNDEYDFAPCDYPACESDGVRHLCAHHFCNAHRWLIVQKAKRKDVLDLFGYVEVEAHP